MPDLDCDWVRIDILGFRTIEIELHGKYPTLDLNVRILFQGVKEKPFDAPLVQYDLLEPRDARDGVWNPIRASYKAGRVGILAHSRQRAWIEGARANAYPKTNLSHGLARPLEQGSISNHLEHMIGLFPDTICKTKAVKYFQRPTLQPIRLPVEDLGATFVNDSRFDSTASCPGGGHQPEGLSAFLDSCVI